MLKQHYETTFGIFDHRAEKIGNQRPWSSLAHLPSNTPGKYYDVEFLIEKYHENGIWDILHISYDVYLTLPPHKMQELDAKCLKIKNLKDQKDASAIETERRTALAALNAKPKGLPSL